MLSERGEVEAATAIFERAIGATGKAAAAALESAKTSGDHGSLLMVQVLHARVEFARLVVEAEPRH